MAKVDRIEEMLHPIKRAYINMYESKPGRFLTMFVNRVATKLFFWSFLSIVNITAILLIFYTSSRMIISLTHHNLGTVLPSIHSYNLVHVIVVLLGNFQAYCSYKLCHEVIVAISAHELLKEVSVNVLSSDYVPLAGSKVDFLNLTIRFV
jgi:hypothetical protein